LPLQSFCALHAFDFVEQALVPLHELIPEHRRFASAPAGPASFTASYPAMNVKPTAVAIRAPLLKLE
jgi:hypothetical protein